VVMGIVATTGRVLEGG